MIKSTSFLSLFAVVISLTRLLPVSAAQAQTAGLNYPETRTVDQIDNYHGTQVADPYRWLENLNTPEVTAWVEAQNELTFDYLEDLPNRKGIERRMSEFLNYAKHTLPTYKGERAFWTENSGLQSHAVLYVKDNPKAEPRVLVDPNTFSDDGTVSMGLHVPSPDGNLLGYGIRVGGSDWQTLHIRDVNSVRNLTDTLRWVKFSDITWTEDSRGFFYSRYDAPKDGRLFSPNTEHQLYYHRVGAPQSADVLILRAQKHPQTRLGAEITDDGRYVLVHQYTSGNWNRSFVLDLGDPMNPNINAKLMPLFTGFDASRELISSKGSTAYILTNKDAPFKHIIAVDLENPAKKNRRIVIPEARKTKSVINRARLIGDRFVVEYLKDAKSVISFYSLKGEPMGALDLPGIGTVSLGSFTGFTQGRDNTEILYPFRSFLNPTTLYRYDFNTGESTVYWAPELPIDLSPYTTEQVFYTSKDGTRVPMFIIRQKDITLDGDNPVIIYGYGGFGAPITPAFAPFLPLWLEMGGIWVFPNLRGGGEYGREWHEAGMREKKQNTFDDFIAAAEYLIRENYTRPEKLGMMGASNGGLLVGAVMVQRPDLFSVALPQAGVYDLLRYHTFVSGQIGLAEYGSSDTAESFDYLYAYSPLHNIEPGTCYPSTLITTADRDDRVPPLHSYKFAAALQAAQGCNNPLLLRVQTNAGHGAGTATSTMITEYTDILSFAAKHLGMKTEQ